MTKKNYIAPNTEMINLASDGIMQSIGILTGSGAATVDNGEAIDWRISWKDPHKSVRIIEKVFLVGVLRCETRDTVFFNVLLLLMRPLVPFGGILAAGFSLSGAPHVRAADTSSIASGLNPDIGCRSSVILFAPFFFYAG